MKKYYAVFRIGQAIQEAHSNSLEALGEIIAHFTKGMGYECVAFGDRCGVVATALGSSFK